MKVYKKLGLLMLFATAATLFAQERDVSKWIEIPCPKDAQSTEGVLWHYRANYSKHEWRVFHDGQKVYAALTTQTNLTAREGPMFKPEAQEFRHVAATLKIADGWLVGFNDGEWGGALYWFSPDGTAKYKISKYQIIDFVQNSSGIYAIVNWGFMCFTNLSDGLIISISQSSNQVPWEVAIVCRLPQAPGAIVQHADGNWLVALSDSFVSVTPDGKIRTIVKAGRWDALWPNSVVLSDDAKTAYIGMRQFVAKITLKNGRVSFLVPDRSYLNQLPKDMEDSIRKIHAN
jgi:hypothetical protein